MKVKNPQNRNSLPSVINSDYDAKNINEIKIKYLKLARLDKITIKTMKIDENNSIHFEDIEFNGKPYVLQDKTKLEFDDYVIQGSFKPEKERWKGGMSQAKYIITIEDKQLREGDTTKRKKTTEREVPNNNILETYKQISGFQNITSKDIYTIKRYIEFKNEMMFYFQFIEEFFTPLDSSKNFYKFKFDNEDNNEKIYNLIQYRTNDDFKNNDKFLKQYLTNKESVVNDFKKVQSILSTFRHALAHFDFEFLSKFFNNDIKNTSFNPLEISFFKTILSQNESKHYSDRLNYLDKDDTIKILDEKEVKLSKLYSFYNHICQKRPAFNKLINSFLSTDGKPNEEVKTYLQTKKFDFYEDIHSNKEYKNIYIKHKQNVALKQHEELLSKPDGIKIKKINDEIQALKKQMDSITKTNSIKRLEVKLRLAFGFIKSAYTSFESFKKSFGDDIKNEKFKTITNDDIKNYFDTSFKEEEFFIYFVKETIKNKKTKKDELKDVKKYIYQDLENDTLSTSTLVEKNNLLQVITLLHLFIPKELKGDFVGFILRIYHEIKNIASDTKADEKTLKELEELEESQNFQALKLKILAKHIKELSVFNYTIATTTKPKKDKDNIIYYEAGNTHLNKFYKECNISHTKEIFDVHVILPMLKYYINLYKLIGDFEIYSLLKYAKEKGKNEPLSTLAKDEFKEGNFYNFKKLLEIVHKFDDSAKDSNNKTLNTIRNLRNQISHQNIEKLFLNFEKKWVFNQRKNIVEFLKSHPMQEYLHYNPINDFTMKTVQFKISLLGYENSRENKIDEILQSKNKTPDDYYLLYKLQAIETIKIKLKEIIGFSEEEETIYKKIGKVKNK